MVCVPLPCLITGRYAAFNGDFNGISLGFHGIEMGYPGISYTADHLTPRTGKFLINGGVSGKII